MTQQVKCLAIKLKELSLITMETKDGKREHTPVSCPLTKYNSVLKHI